MRPHLFGVFSCDLLPGASAPVHLHSCFIFSRVLAVGPVGSCGLSPWSVAHTARAGVLLSPCAWSSAWHAVGAYCILLRCTSMPWGEGWSRLSVATSLSGHAAVPATVARPVLVGVLVTSAQRTSSLGFLPTQQVLIRVRAWETLPAPSLASEGPAPCSLLFWYSH